ncbi:hypothetical protein Cni_G20471 [Canna indica]|uniref:HMA domain-containing protein n=1 Tax=Canna indica TaxID=4628 RepID=A0AAQ3KQ12_9LILI|nr:hypothetical protein Cni_G20471 [Canna indica]
MSKAEEFKLLKIQTVVLKVHIHCDGCRQEVKKLLQKIEGVYTVSIDAEHQKVTVSGNVDSKTLIKKLAKAGKHAEIWSQKPSNNQISKSNQQQQQQHQHHQGKDDKSKNKDKHSKDNKGSNQAFIQGLKAFKNQHKTIEPFSSEDEAFDDDNEEEDYEDDELGMLADKLKQLNLLNQQPNKATAAAAAAANSKNIGNNGGAKDSRGNNPNQAAVGMKALNGLQPKGFPMAPNNKINNGAPLVGSGNNLSAMEGKMGNGLMGLPSLQGLHGGNGLGLHQAQHHHQQLGSNQAQHQHHHQQLGSTNFPTGYPTNANGGFGVNNNPSSLMMNMRGINSNNNNGMLINESRNIQPQVVYNRSPQIPPYTGYCYPYPYYRSPYVSYYPETGGYSDHLFSDENTSGCMVM